MTIEKTTLRQLPKLTVRQEEALLYIASFLSRNRYFPTNKEICEAMGATTNNASPFITPLVTKGYLGRIQLERRARNYELTEIGLEKLELMKQKDIFE